MILVISIFTATEVSFKKVKFVMTHVGLHSFLFGQFLMNCTDVFVNNMNSNLFCTMRDLLRKSTGSISECEFLR